jgi:hypothetical protein
MRRQIRIRYGALLAATVLAAQGLPVLAQNVGDIVTGAVLQQLMNGNQRQRNNRGLPVTSMDSFVLNAGGSAEAIYGDEGVDGPPPYFGFSADHRIDAGIQGQRSAGLTTGHGSIMPDAWGGDEFIGQEWCSTNRGRPPMNIGGQNLDAAALGQAAASAAAGLVGGAIQNGVNNSGGATAPPQVPTDPNAGLPPPPGPGYQPAYVHGQFVGYYSPEEVALAQTDFPHAFQAFVNSGRYIGDPVNAQYILQNEMGLTP